MSGLRRVGQLGLFLMISASSVSADVILVDRKLSCDVLVWSGGHFWRLTQGGLGSNELAFERGFARVGVTGTVTSVVSLRVSCDVAGLAPQDVYADMRLQNGFGLRIGQFQLPLGADLMTDKGQTKLVNNSLLTAYDGPAGALDMGLLGTYLSSRFQGALAVINGSGANTDDRNNRRDLCGRVAFRPWLGKSVEFAARGYIGWPDTTGIQWRTAAAEVSVRRGNVSLNAEFQNHSSADLQNNACYLQSGLDIGLFEPVLRFDLVLPSGKKADVMGTAGFNLWPLGDNFKVLLDCSYRRNYQDNWSVFGFLLRLQATI